MLSGLEMPYFMWCNKCVAKLLTVMQNGSVWYWKLDMYFEGNDSQRSSS